SFSRPCQRDDGVLEGFERNFPLRGSHHCRGLAGEVETPGRGLAENLIEEREIGTPVDGESFASSVTENPETPLIEPEIGLAGEVETPGRGLAENLIEEREIGTPVDGESFASSVTENPETPLIEP